MSLLYRYTFDIDSENDGAYRSGDKILPKMYNFGTWSYNDEVSYDHGEGACVLWRSKLATAVTTFKDFTKGNIENDQDYVLTVRLKVIKPLNDFISVGFFRSSGDFNVLNEGPLKGAGPFTKIGNGNKADKGSIIKAVDFDCGSITDDFTEIKVSVNGAHVCRRMSDNSDEDPIYVGIMNFAHREEPDDTYIAISEIKIEKEPAIITLTAIDFYKGPDNSNRIPLLLRYSHGKIGDTIDYKNEELKLTGFSIAICDTIDLQTKVVDSGEGSDVIIDGFETSRIYDEISFLPKLSGVTKGGSEREVYGEKLSFSLYDLYFRCFKNDIKIPKEVSSWFKPSKKHQINVYNASPVNEDFSGFGALYYPWIYIKDKSGRNYTEEEAKTELDRLKISGVKIARATVFANPDWYNESRNSWNFDDEDFAGLVRSFSGMSERQIDIMLNFEWGNSINYGPIFENKEFAKYPFEKQCEIFGTFVRDFVTALKNRRVKTVKYLTFFSEPANGIKGGFESEEGKKLQARYEKCIGSVHNSLCAAGIREEYKLVLGNVALGTEIWNYTWQNFKPVFDVLKPFADEWSYHNYNRYSSPYENTASAYEKMMAYVDHDITRKTGVKAKDVWIDEYNALDRNNSWFEFRNSTKWYPIQIVAGMVANINIGYKTILHWTFINTLWVDSHANGKDNWSDGHHCWGLIPHPHQDKRPYNSFYAYQMVASHMTGGRTFRGDNSAESGLCCCACENADGTFTVIVVNSGVFEGSFILNFEKKLAGLKFDRYIFEACKNYRSEKTDVIASDKKISDVVTSLEDTIPAGSVAVYRSKTRQEKRK